MTASQKLGEKMYADDAGRSSRPRPRRRAVRERQRGAAAPSGRRPADDNVVDAEFKEVKK